MVTKIGTEKDAGKRIRQRQGHKIREARKLRQLTSSQLAALIGVTESAVIHWENGRFSPRQPMQVKIAKALDVPWSFLFGLDGEAA